MRRVLTIVAILSSLGVTARAGAIGDWRVIALSGEVRVLGAPHAAGVGEVLPENAVIQTGASGQVTLARNGASIVVPANTRLSLAGEPHVEHGRAVFHHVGALHDETLTAPSIANTLSASVAPAATTVAAPEAPVVPAGALRSSSMPSRMTAAPLNSRAQSAPSAVPAARIATQGRALGSGGMSGQRVSAVPASARAPAAPALRIATAIDTDLGASGGAHLRLDDGGDAPALSRKTTEQQAAAISAVWSDARQQSVAPIDRQAAETLLHAVPAGVAREKAWAERPQAIVDSAGNLMAAIILLQLLSMGLLALWRYTRKPKAPQAEPRWRAIGSGSA